MDKQVVGSTVFLVLNFLFQEILSGTISECQTVWIQIRIHILSVLIWVQIVCKDDQHMTKVAPSKEKLKGHNRYGIKAKK